MTRIPSVVWAALVLGGIHAFLEYGIAPITGALTGTPAPLPSSLVLMYEGMGLAAILLFLSLREERWQAFLQPIAGFVGGGGVTSRGASGVRVVVLVLLPVLVGWHAFAGASAATDPPGDPPGIHFSLPNRYSSMQNPLPWTPENIREGGVLYTRNCAMCHGDAQDGEGLFARAWQPKPASFRDSGTIAQLDENYLFWRIKEGGPGVPRGSIEYRSAMPVWDGALSDDQIWKVIMFEYTNAGVKPAKRR